MPLASGDWAYLCTYQDMGSKQVVGRPVLAPLPEELITIALQRASWAQLPTPGLFVHSDCGGAVLLASHSTFGPLPFLLRTATS